MSRELVQQRCRCDQIKGIKKLNLYSMELGDVSIISEMPAVEEVSLSLNNISSLRPFAKCPEITELYLRKNNVSDLKEILHLRNLSKLKVLWLACNPVSENPYYRIFIVKHLPHLTKLDNEEVKQEERDAAAKFNPEVALGSSENMQSKTPTPPPMVRKSSNNVLQTNNQQTNQSYNSQRPVSPFKPVLQQEKKTERPESALSHKQGQA